VNEARKVAVKNKNEQEKLREEDLMLQGMQIASQQKGGKGIPQQYTH